MGYYVGLTGNIASGKSAAAQIFSQLNIDVFSADKVSRELTLNDKSVILTILNHFGEQIKQPDGQIDRKQLREIIFTDSTARQWLESLLHPLIRKKMEEMVASSKTQYCVVEIPLLLDKKNYPYLNCVLLITASEDIQIERVMQRDNCTYEQAMAILAAQPTIEQRLELADYVVENDTTLQGLKDKIMLLHHTFNKLSQN